MTSANGGPTWLRALGCAQSGSFSACRSSGRVGLIVPAALALGGCLPVALPPFGVVAGGGVGSAAKGSGVATRVFEATVRPLAAIGSRRDRSFDVGGGIAVETAGDVTRYGPSLDVRVFPLNAVISPSLRARLGTASRVASSGTRRTTSGRAALST